MPKLALPAIHFQPTTWRWLSVLIVVVILAAVTSSWLLWQNIQLQQANQHQHSDQQSFLEQSNQLTVQLATIQGQKAELEKQVADIQATSSSSQWTPLQQIFDLYSDIQTKVDRNNLAKIDTKSTTDSYANWGNLLLSKKHDELRKSLTDTQTVLDTQFQQYQASLPKATPVPTKAATASGGGGSTANPSGYSSSTVNTSRGAFAVKLIKLPLNQYTVKTVTGADSACTNNCPAKTLAQYVAENGAYAGINGSYFCPPDYASCAGKTYSFDFAVFNSRAGNWHNPNARFWDSIGMITFTGSTAQAYKNGATYPGHAVTAAISNFPPLILFNNQVNSDENSQSLAQKSRNLKGALGVNGTDIFLVVASGVSITDLATVMQSLGATHALNLDGGGSSALYISGAYKAGPGRLLPNAIVLVKN